jgi:hypothetical protein
MPKSSRTPSIVIADWLKSTPMGQYTHFEAAMSLMDCLQDEGLYVMRREDAIEMARVHGLLYEANSADTAD